MADLIGEVRNLAVGDDFAIVPLVPDPRRGASGRQWVRMIHPPCAAEVDFTSPTPLRVHWYERVHDCDAPFWMRVS
jgi:hypothetical protein